jgi:hypothetical protein
LDIDAVCGGGQRDAEAVEGRALAVFGRMMMVLRKPPVAACGPMSAGRPPGPRRRHRLL